MGKKEGTQVNGKGSVYPLLVAMDHKEHLCFHPNTTNQVLRFTGFFFVVKVSWVRILTGETWGGGSLGSIGNDEG